MALIVCKECGNEVSSNAKSCPKCGAILRKPSRSILGKIVKWIFIFFNLIMIFWTVSVLGISSDAVATSISDAEVAGTAIGTGIGMFFIAIIWLIGAVILGILTLLTRPK